MVDGFGGQYEEGDQKLIPRGLVAYRMFRFVPRPKFLINGQPVEREWQDFASGKPPVWVEWDSAPDYRTKAAYRYEAAGQPAPEDRALYHGRGVWYPSLVAVSYGHVAYTAGVNEAYCAAEAFVTGPSHQPPQKGCHCGFWAYYQPYVMDVGNTVAWTLIAAVEVSGDVVLGTKGVRAQKMRILGVLPPDELVRNPVESIVEAWESVVKSLGVRQYDGLKELLEAYPPQDVSELLPKTPAPEPVLELSTEFLSGCPCAMCREAGATVLPAWQYNFITPNTYWNISGNNSYYWNISGN